MRNNKAATSRQLAVTCLTDWARKKQPIASLMDTVIHGSGLKAGDRYLAVKMVQGVLRQMQYLDMIIARFSKFPVAKMKTLTVMALRVGVFQILFLDRVPDSAAVNETVNVLKLEKQPRWLLNFVNGVLRNIVRNKQDMPAPGADTRDNGSPLNHPEWLVQRWQKRFGPERARTICRENNKEPFLGLRVNTRDITTEELTALFRQEGYDVRSGKYASDSLILDTFSGPVSSLPGYEDGLFHVQDEAAQLVTTLMGPFAEGARYLDGCAGLGGKTCQLAELIPQNSELVAVEPNRRRIQLLKENLHRLHCDVVTMFQGPLGLFCSSGPGLFRGVLIDAPCSGTGVIRRHPDIRWNRLEVDLKTYRRQQAELLQQAALIVEPGGILVYATCSIEPEENMEVVESFLRDHGEFSVTDCCDYLPEKAAAVTVSGFFSPTPADGMDGFFGARLVRNA